MGTRDAKIMDPLYIVDYGVVGSPVAAHLIALMLERDAGARISASGALGHPLFAPASEAEDEMLAAAEVTSQSFSIVGRGVRVVPRVATAIEAVFPAYMAAAGYTSWVDLFPTLDPSWGGMAKRHFTPGEVANVCVGRGAGAG
jgi:hypothetical protein